MIARVAVTPSALLELGSGQPERRAKADHEHLLRAIRIHGALSFEGDQAAAQFIRTVRQQGKNLPHGVAGRWLTLVAELRKNSRVRFAQPPIELPTEGTLQELAESWGDEVEVFIVDQQRGAALRIPEETGFAEVAGKDFEAATSDAACDCSHFRHYQKLTDGRGIPAGANRDTFWDDVLGPLARNSKRVTIVDRYLFKALWSRRRRYHEQTAWIMQRLDQEYGFGGYVELIAEGDASSPSARVTSTMLLSAWRRGQDQTVRSVRICLTAPKDHVVPHDRHIRFDGGAIGLGAGFDRLGRSNVIDKDGLTWDFRWDKEPIDRLREAERRCLQDERSDIFEIEPSGNSLARSR